MGYFVQRSSTATLFGYEIYGDNCPKIIEELYYFLVRVDDVIRWVAYRTWDKYHIVKTDLEPSYYDVDEIMFRAAFALLRRFVEEELGTENWYPDQPDCMYRGYRRHFEGDANKQAIDLWHWYTTDLPAMEKAIEDFIRRDRTDEGITWVPAGDGLVEMKMTEAARASAKTYGDMEHELSEAKQNKLEELVKLRRHLWT